jgi:hypothetical protein
MKTFEEWRQSDEAWFGPRKGVKPNLDTMLRRAWNAGAMAERERAIMIVDDIEKDQRHIDSSWGGLFNCIRYWIVHR